MECYWHETFVVVTKIGEDRARVGCHHVNEATRLLYCVMCEQAPCSIGRFPKFCFQGFSVLFPQAARLWQLDQPSATDNGQHVMGLVLCQRLAIAEHFPAAEDMEQSMLEFAENATDQSRLSCQITVTDAMDGAIITVPDAF